MDDNKTILNEEELQKIILAFQAGHDGPINEEDTLKVIRWAEQAQVDHALLENVLDGYVSVDVKRGEVVFKITEDGRSTVEHSFIPGSESIIQ